MICAEMAQTVRNGAGGAVLVGGALCGGQGRALRSVGLCLRSVARLLGAVAFRPFCGVLWGRSRVPLVGLCVAVPLVVLSRLEFLPVARFLGVGGMVIGAKWFKAFRVKI